MKICPVGVQLFHADGETDGLTDMTKLIVVFRNIVNALKILICDPKVSIDLSRKNLRDFRFWQRCCWRLESSWMFFWTVVPVFTDRSGVKLHVFLTESRNDWAFSFTNWSLRFILETGHGWSRLLLTGCMFLFETFVMEFENKLSVTTQHMPWPVCHRGSRVRSQVSLKICSGQSGTDTGFFPLAIRFLLSVINSSATDAV